MNARQSTQYLQQPEKTYTGNTNLRRDIANRKAGQRGQKEIEPDSEEIEYYARPDSEDSPNPQDKETITAKQIEPKMANLQLELEVVTRKEAQVNSEQENSREYKDNRRESESVYGTTQAAVPTQLQRKIRMGAKSTGSH